MVGNQTDLERVVCVQVGCTEEHFGLAHPGFDLGCAWVNPCSSTLGRDFFGRCWSGESPVRSSCAAFRSRLSWQGQAQGPGSGFGTELMLFTYKGDQKWGPEPSLNLGAGPSPAPHQPQSHQTCGQAPDPEMCTRCAVSVVMPSAFFWGDNNTGWSIFNSAP